MTRTWISLLLAGSLFMLLMVFTSQTQAGSGFITEYELSGKSIGNTKLEGNVEILESSDFKRVTGNLVFEDPGNPYPNLDEKDIVVDYAKKTKYLKTSESMKWVSTPLSDDYNQIKDNLIKSVVTRDNSDMVATVTVSLPPAVGGVQIYSARFSFSTKPETGEVESLTKIGNPTTLDLITVFIDNEKIVDTLKLQLKEVNYRIPDKFTFMVQQGGKSQLDVKGVLRSKISISPTEKWAQMK